MDFFATFIDIILTLTLFLSSKCFLDLQNSRPLGTDPQTGQIDPELKRLALEEYTGQFGLRGN